MSEALCLDPSIKKSKPSATISKAPNTTAETDFLDYVSITNNADDFDLTSILKQLEASEQMTSNTHQNNSVQNTVDSRQNAVALNSPAVQANAFPNENALTPSQVVQNVANNKRTQNHPFEPKMVFQNSSVTINYNFNNYTKPT